MSDIAFVVIASTVLIGLLSLIAIPLWNAMKPERDPNKLLVRQWLKENLENGSWEEVKWYPARTVTGLRDLNLLHIVEAMEADKASFERGVLKEDKSAEYQELFKRVRETEPRTFCAMKFRTATLNGQAKTLRNQIFEISNGKAKTLKANDISEMTAPVMKNRHLPSYDGWRYFDDHEYEPFPNEPVAGLENRFQAALVWKVPAQVSPPVATLAAATPATPATATKANPLPSQLQPLASPPPSKPNPTPESSLPEIPRRIRDYFDREAQARAAEAAVLEKRLATFETRLRTAKPSQIAGVEDRIRATKDELAEVKRKRIAAPLPDHPLVGDIGAMPVMEVIEVIDDETVLARWLPNGKGRLPKLEVAITTIERSQLKEGNSLSNTDEIYRVAATKDEPTEKLEKLIAAGKKPEFVVETADSAEIKKWRVDYENEIRSKK